MKILPPDGTNHNQSSNTEILMNLQGYFLTLSHYISSLSEEKKKTDVLLRQIIYSEIFQKKIAELSFILQNYREAIGEKAKKTKVSQYLFMTTSGDICSLLQNFEEGKNLDIQGEINNNDNVRIICTELLDHLQLYKNQVTEILLKKTPFGY